MTTDALYIRTSTADQDGRAQFHALRQAAAARGWSSPREFVDLGHSGSKASRPALDELKAAVNRGEIRGVMVFALDVSAGRCATYSFCWINSTQVAARSSL